MATKKTTESKTPFIDHITPKGKSLDKALQREFGLNLEDFQSVVQGDVTITQKIGEQARKGRLMAEFAPKLAVAYNEIIQGTLAQNRAYAEILQNAGKSGIELNKLEANTQLANSKYGHERSELAAQFVASKDAESQRHVYQLNYVQMKAYIDAYTTQVDRDATLLEQSYKPELKQIATDEQYKSKVMNHVLSQGDNARVDLIPQKNYNHANFRESIGAKFEKFKVALGFE